MFTIDAFYYSLLSISQPTSHCDIHITNNIFIPSSQEYYWFIHCSLFLIFDHNGSNIPWVLISLRTWIFIEKGSMPYFSFLQCSLYEEEFEDTKGAIRIRISDEEEQTTQWPKEKVQKDKQRSTKHTHKTKNRVTRTSLKPRVLQKGKQFLLH